MINRIKRLLGISDNLQKVDAKGISDNHQITRTLHEVYNVPPHEPRTASALFERSREDLIVTKDTPCFICAVRQSTLKDPVLNKKQATQLEAHHRIEWSFSNAVDFKKVQVDYPDFENWDKVLAGDSHLFIDAPINLIVLCDKCHRGSFGVHSITYPLWLAQKYLRDDFKLQ